MRSGYWDPGRKEGEKVVVLVMTSTVHRKGSSAVTVASQEGVLIAF